MARHHILSGAEDAQAVLNVRRIGVADLKSALAEGFSDFWAMPTHLLFIGLLYPLIGIFFAGFIFGYNMLPMLFPLMSGFALVGPFAAIGLYELSRRREQGLDITWQSIADIQKSPALGSIATLGLILMAIFLTWLIVAQMLYQALFGWHAPDSMSQFFHEVISTRTGWTMIIVGNLLGFVFSLLVFAISVVSFPLLLDRDVGVVPAVLTSIKAVSLNPGPMALWALIVGLSLMIGFIPLFIGLAVVLPVLGHATWHLYRRLVVS